VSQFLTDWLELTHKHSIRPRTYERYEEAIRLHLIPVLGKYRLQMLSAQHVQAFYVRMTDKGLYPSTVIYYHSVMHNALGTAVKWGLIPRNVCDLVTPPRKARFEIRRSHQSRCNHLSLRFEDISGKRSLHLPWLPV
jgi:integrase